MHFDPLVIFLIVLAAVCLELPRLRNGWKAKKAATEKNAAVEKSETEARRQVLAEAAARALPDAIFLITCHNRDRKHSLWRIDPCQIYPREIPAVLAGWEKKSEQLLSMKRYVGFGVATGRGDRARSTQELEEWNPGFSEETYVQAIRLNTRASRPDI